jgi:hypothetical protein
LLATDEVAALLCYSIQWVEIARHRGFGPPFIRLSPRRVRYLRSDVIAWLKTRRHASTAEYETTGGRPRKVAEADDAAA